MPDFRDHELFVAEVLGGKVHRGSGSSIWMKSDNHVEGLRDLDLQGECKSTKAASIRMVLDVLKKIRREAEQVHRIPLVAFRLQGEGWVMEDWAAIPLRKMGDLLRELRELRKYYRETEAELAELRLKVKEV